MSHYRRLEVVDVFCERLCLCSGGVQAGSLRLESAGWKRKSRPERAAWRDTKKQGFQPINFLRATPKTPMSPVPSNSKLDGSGVEVVTAAIVRVLPERVKVPGPLNGPKPSSPSEQVSVPDRFVMTAALLAVGLDIVAESITVHPKKQCTRRKKRSRSDRRTYSQSW
jgi:hypothetical protein